MAKKDDSRFVYGRFTKGSDYLRLAKPPKAIVTRNGGSHAKIEIAEGEYTGQSMIVCERELGIGLSHKIWSWCKMVGLLTLAMIIFASAVSIMGL